MKVGDHLAKRGDTAGHVAQEIELVAIIDADVGIYRPEQDTIDAAVAFIEVIEVAIDGVAAGYGIVEIAVLDHGLRLHETALCPGEGGARVDFGIESGAGALFVTPGADVAEP